MPLLSHTLLSRVPVGTRVRSVSSGRFGEIIRKCLQPSGITGPTFTVLWDEPLPTDLLDDGSQMFPWYIWAHNFEVPSQ